MATCDALWVSRAAKFRPGEGYEERIHGYCPSLIHIFGIGSGGNSVGNWISEFGHNVKMMKPFGQHISHKISRGLYIPMNLPCSNGAYSYRCCGRAV